MEHRQTEQSKDAPSVIIKNKKKKDQSLSESKNSQLFFSLEKFNKNSFNTVKEKFEGPDSEPCLQHQSPQNTHPQIQENSHKTIEKELSPNKQMIVSLVRCLKTWNKDKVLQELKQAFDTDNSIHLKIPTKIRYLARKFELPSFLLQPIWDALKAPTIELTLKVHLAQALKYGVRNDLRNNLDITCQNLIELIDGSPAEIRSEIVWALGYKIKNSAEELANEFIEKINSKIAKDVVPEAKAFLKSQIAQHDYTINEQIWQENRDPLKLFNENFRRKPKVLITKNQQTMKSKYKNSLSQESIFNVADILESLLNQNKSRGRLKTRADEFKEEKIERKGSHRSWTNGTYKDVKALYERAKSGETITDEDKDGYLTNKFLNGSKYWTGGPLGDLITDRMIAATFHMISKTQKLTNATIEKLVICLEIPAFLSEKYYCKNEKRTVFLLEVLSSNLPPATNKLETRISTRLKEMQDSQGMNRHLLDSVEQLFLKEIYRMRRDAISALYNRALRDQNVLTSQHLEKIRDCLQDADRRTRALAARIGSLIEDQELDDARIIFDAYMRQIEKKIDLEHSLDYLDQQSKDPRRCEPLFTDEIVLRLSEFLKKPVYDYPTKTNLCEILNNTLEHSFTSGLNLDVLKNICSIFGQANTEGEQTDKLKLEETALISILLTAEKESNLSQEIIIFLVERIRILSDHSVNFLVIILGKICGQPTLNIPFPEELSQKLLDDRVIIDNGIETTFGPRQESNSPHPAISEITARIVLSFLKRGNKASPDVLNNLVEALASSDKQTRIQAAKAVAFASERNLASLDKDILARLEDYLADRIPDVAIYCTHAYTSILQRLPADDISSSQLDVIATIYAYEELTPGRDEEFSSIAASINENILAVLANQADKQAFSENVFGLFDFIFLSDDQNKQVALDIMKIYTHKNQFLPERTVFAIENVLGHSELFEKALDVLQKVIENGQKASEKTLQIFADNLFFEESGEEMKSTSFKMLETADINQDLSDHIFEVLELERAGLAVHHDFEEEEALKFLQEKTFTGSQLPSNVLRALNKHLSHPLTLSILINISTNEGFLPQFMLDEMNKTFYPVDKHEKLAKLFFNLCKNNQNIPTDLWKKLEQLLDNEALAEQTLLIFTYQAKKGEQLSENVIQKICDTFFITADQSLKQECLSAFCKIVQMRIDVPQNLIEEVLIQGLSDKNEHIVSISLKGFDLLSKKNPLSPEIIEVLVRKAIDSACPSDMQQMIISLLDPKQLSKKQASQLKKATLNPEQEIEFLVSLNESAKKGEEFLKRNFLQINTLISKSGDFQKAAILMLDRYPEKTDIPDDLIDNIAKLMFSTSLVELRERCLSLIGKIADSGKIIPEKVVSLVAALPNTKEILELIRENQAIPEAADLLLQIDSISESANSKRVADLLYSIILELDRGFRVTEDAITKLISLTENNTNVKDFALIFSRALLQDVKFADEIVVGIIERAIGMKDINFYIVRAYAKLIKDQKYQRLTESLEVLIEFLLQNKYQKDSKTCLEIFSCVANASDLCDNGFILMENNINNPNKKIRAKCFQGLQARKNNGHQSKIFEAYCAELLEKLQACTELPVHLEVDLLETLASCEYFHFDKLKQTPREHWIRELLLSDLLTHLNANESERSLLRGEWLYTEQYLKSQNFDSSRLLKALSSCSTLLRFEEIHQAIKFLPKIDFYQAENTLLESLNPFEELQQQWLFCVLSKCLIIDISANQLAMSISSRLTTQIISKLFDVISTIDNLSEFDSLIDFLNENNIKEDDIQIKDWVSIKQLRRSLETKLLKSSFQSQNNFDKFPMILDSLLDRDWPFPELMKISKQVEGSSVFERRIKERNILLVLEMLAFYKIPPTTNQRILEILEDCKVSEWIKKVNQVAIEANFQANPQVKDHRDLVEELKNLNIQNLYLQNLLQENPNLFELIDQIQKTKLSPQTDPVNLRKAEILGWAKKVKSNTEFWAKPESLKEALIKINEANALYRPTRFSLNNAQILSCLMLLNANSEKGRLLQVGTGEGKSTIVSVVAIILALQGKKVDIITSSPVLAERDSKEKADLYRMFNLSCADNADKSLYVRGPKRCYKQDIVYGEIAQFQFDTLRDKYSLLGTLARRKCEVVIVDEVDSMLLDDSSNIARLSSTIAGMDLLQPFIHLLWHRLNFLQQAIILVDGKYQVSEQASKIPNIQEFAKNLEDLNKNGDVEKFLQDQLKNYLANEIIEKKVILVPENFREFVEIQIPKWIESAIRALMMQEDQQYVIQEGMVKPVAFDSTGVVQNATSWGDSLHQFIQRKHGLKMTSETFTTNFLSSVGFIRKYGKNLFGLTGTSGSEKAKETLSAVYNVDIVIIPNLHEKQFLELPPIVCKGGQKQWLEEICESAINEANKGRGTLIICQTIEHCKLIGFQLAKKYRSGAIKLYTMNNMNQEREIDKINLGEVIVATNLAGRGTDIKADNIESSGGLHVILTFLPPNQRVEDQAFGRTARQGKRGTGQMILNITLLFNNNENACLHEIKGVKELRDMRDKSESRMLDEFVENELKMVLTKDELFEKFCVLKNKIHKKLQAQTGFLQKLFGSSIYEINMLNALEERWALFLHKIDNARISLKESNEKYDSFEAQIFQDLDNQELIKNPLYHITVVNHLLNHSSSSTISDVQYNQAVLHYKKAAELDPLQCPAAGLVGRAWLAIKNVKRSGKSKTEIREDLKKSLELLNNEMFLLNTLQAFVEQDFPDFECDLFKQLVEKTSIIGSYMNSVENILTVVTKSQRLIEITGIRDSRVMKNFDGIERTPELSPKLYEDYNKFNLVFNDLTIFSDNGDRDQAIETLKNIFDESHHPEANSSLNPTEYNKDLTITLCDITYERLKIIFDEDIEIQGATKNLALDELKKDLSSSCRVNLECVKNGQIEEKSSDLEVKDTVALIKAEHDEEVRFNILLKDANEAPKLIKEEQTSNGMIVTLKYANLACKTAKRKLTRLQFDHLHLEFSGTKAEISNALLKTTETVQLRTVDDHIEIVTVEVAKQRIEEMKERKIWIKLEKLNKEAAEQIIDICPTTKNFQVSFAFTKLPNIFEDPEGSELISVSFSPLSSKFATKLIPILRKIPQDFTLGFNNLTFDQVKDVITKASLKQEDIQITKVKKLSDLFMKNSRPNIELSEFAERGIQYMLEINEKKPIPWRALLTVAAVGTLQIAAGGILLASGVGFSSGLGIITEGTFDYMAALVAYRKRHFRWSDYRRQKVISLMLSAISIGVGNLMGGTSRGVDAAIRSGVKKEAIEQVGTQVVKVGGGLGRLAIQQVMLTTLGAVARTGLSSFVDSLVNFALEKFKPEISSFIQTKIEDKFREESLKTLISKMYALDKIKNTKQFSNQIKNQIVKIICPNNQNNHDLWNSIGGPLCRGILSNAKVIGSAFSMRVRIIATLSGLTQIAFMIDSIYSQLVKRLSDIDKTSLSVHQLLSQIHKIPTNEAIEISKILKEKKIIQIYEYEIPNQTAAKITKTALERSFARNDHYYFSLMSDVAGVIGATKAQKTSPQKIQCETINSQMFPIERKQSSEQKDTAVPRKPSQEKIHKSLQEIYFTNNEVHKQNVVKFCADLNKFTQNLDEKDLSMLKKEISDMITDQIIKVTESHLISPWSTYGVGMFTNNISAKAQDHLVRDHPKCDSEEIKDEEHTHENHPAAENESHNCLNVHNENNGHKSADNEIENGESPAEKENWRDSFKEIAESLNTVTLLGTKTGEFYLKATGGHGRQTLVRVITGVNITRFTAVSWKMGSELINSAEEMQELPFDIFKKIFHNVAENGFDMVEAASEIKLKCLEQVQPILEKLKKPAKKLKEADELIEGDQDEAERKSESGVDEEFECEAE